MKTIFRLTCLCLLLGVSPAVFAQDCGGPPVTYGEVQAGFQAGLTMAGAIVLSDEAEPLAANFFLNTFGIEEQRGFIDPEGNYGWLCEGDWALVSSWFAIPQPIFDRYGLLPAEVLTFVNFSLQTRILVDGVEYEPVELRAKPGYFSFGDLTEAYAKAWGVFFEPGSLAVGTRTAELRWRLDLDCHPLFGGVCDGEYETDAGGVVYEFEVIANP